MAMKQRLQWCVRLNSLFYVLRKLCSFIVCSVSLSLFLCVCVCEKTLTQIIMYCEKLYGRFISLYVYVCMCMDVSVSMFAYVCVCIWLHYRTVSIPHKWIWCKDAWLPVIRTDVIRFQYFSSVSLHKICAHQS